jgi:hypothetical protein
MPTFTGIEVTTTADVDFEIFCAGCGAGICSNGDTRKSRSRQMPQVTIEPCEKCLAAARSEGEDKARAELESRIADLEAELDETKNAHVA